MAEKNTLLAEKRTTLGTISSRKLRRNGRIPANLFGHGQDSVAVSLPEDAVSRIIHSGAHIVDLDLEGTNETAIIREIQWNTFSTHINHVDLMRVDANELVTVDVSIELRGSSPGAMAGGLLDQHLHALTIDCPAIQIPNSIPVRIGELEIGDSIQVSELELPDEINVHNSPETIIVRVLQPKEEEEITDDAAEITAAEPEVIGRKTEDEGSEES